MEYIPNHPKKDENGPPVSVGRDLEPTPAQFTGKVGGVRQHESLALVNDPQPPLSVCYRPPGSVQSGASLTGTVDSVDSVRVQEPRVVYSVGNGLCSQNLGRGAYKMIYQYKDLSMKEHRNTKLWHW